MSHKSQNFVFEEGIMILVLVGICVAAVIAVGLIAMWILAVVAMILLLFIVPLALPAFLSSYLMMGFAKATHSENSNQYEPRVNPIAPVVTYAAVLCLFIFGMGFPETHHVRVDPKTKERWVEIQWPWLVNGISSFKRTIMIGNNEKREFRVSQLNQDGDYFIPRPKRKKKAKEKQKTWQQQRAEAYGPQPPLGYVPPDEWEEEPFREILEIKLPNGSGDTDGIPYDASFLKWLIFVSLLFGTPAVFGYIMNQYLKEERTLALKRVEEFLNDEKAKRSSIAADLRDEKINSENAIKEKNEEIETLKARIAEIAKMQVALTETLIPGTAVGIHKVDEEQKLDKKAAPIKPKGALGSDFL